MSEFDSGNEDCPSAVHEMSRNEEDKISKRHLIVDAAIGLFLLISGYGFYSLESKHSMS